MEAIIISGKQEELELGLRRENGRSLYQYREPQKALGVDIGGGTIVRYIESSGEVGGIALIGIKKRVLESLTGVS